MPLKCVEIDASKGKTDDKKQRRLLSNQEQEAHATVNKQFITDVRKLMSGRLLDESSTSEGGKQSYIMFMSCVPVDGEEKLSVLGFEVCLSVKSLLSQLLCLFIFSILLFHGLKLTALQSVVAYYCIFSCEFILRSMDVTMNW